MCIKNCRNFFMIISTLILMFFLFFTVDVVSGARINNTVLNCESSLIDNNTALVSISKNDIVDLVVTLDQAGSNVSDIVYWIDNDILSLSYDLDSDYENNLTNIILHIQAEKIGSAKLTISSAEDYYTNAANCKTYKFVFTISEYKQIVTLSGSIYENNMPSTNKELSLNLLNYDTGKIVVTASPAGLFIKDFHFEYDSSIMQISYEMDNDSNTNTTRVTILIVPLHEGKSDLKISSSLEENFPKEGDNGLLFTVNVITTYNQPKSYFADVIEKPLTDTILPTSTLFPSPTFSLSDIVYSTPTPNTRIYSSNEDYGEFYQSDGSGIICRVHGCGKRPVYTNWDDRFCSEHLDHSKNHKDEYNPYLVSKKYNTVRALTKAEVKALRGTGYKGTRPNSSAEDLELRRASCVCPKCGMLGDRGNYHLCYACQFNKDHGLD